MAKDQAGDSPAELNTTEQLLAERTELERRLEAALAAGELEVGDDPDAKLVAALAAAQGEYPRIEKTKTGTVSGTNRSGAAYSYDYSYADLGDVLGAVRPVLSRHGLALVQRTITDAGKVTLITELRHVGGGIIESVVELGQTSANPQQFGGALTYLRRYEAGTLLGVAPEEDTDARGVQPSDAGGGKQQPPELPPWATDLSRERLANELGPRLTALLGEEGAREAVRVVKANLGGVPAIVSMTTGLILDSLLAAGADEVLGRLAGEQDRRRKAAQEAEVRAEAERQAAERAEAEAAQEAAEAPDVAPETTETTEDVIARVQAEASGAPDEEADEAPAGSRPMPDISALEGLEAEAALRAAGCTCDSPLEAMLSDEARNITCPLEGHGIPF